MLFLVSNDADDEMIEISPSIARTLVKAFRKQHSYWQYRFLAQKKKMTGKLTIEQLTKISLMENKANFYSALVDDLTGGIDKCEYQKSRCN